MQTHINHFLSWKEDYGIRPNTIKSYRRCLMSLQNYAGQCWEDYTTEKVQHHFKLLSEKNGGHYIAIQCGIVKDFFRYHERDTKVQYCRLRVPSRYVVNSHKPIPKEYYEKILKVCQGDELSQVIKNLVFRLLWQCGMRVQEVCDLNISQLSQDSPMGNYAEIVTRKNYQKRWIFWSKTDGTHDLLLRYLGMRLTLNQEDYLFFAPDVRRGRRQRICVKTVQRWLKELCIRAGIPHITTHQFRASFAHHLIYDLKIDSLNASRLMGHSQENIQSIMPYTKPTKAEYFAMWKKVAS